MRVISGTCKGRKLTTISGYKIRPTSDRVKEAVFNILGPEIKRKTVLDLFAGTGSLGIEALSRGAGHATFLDLSCDIVNANLALCRLKKNAVVIERDIITQNIPENLHGLPFDLIFMDPPYGKNIIEHLLKKDPFFIQLKRECIIITEHSFKETLDIQNTGLDIYRQKKYSKTVISFIKKVAKG